MGYKYTIPGTPITKKNSMQMARSHSTGRLFPVPSAAYRKYQDTAARYLQPPPAEAINRPVRVSCVYYMPTRRPVDLTNLMEATHDILVKFGILADDNNKVVASVDGSRVRFDKEDPRVEITITEEDDVDD